MLELATLGFRDHEIAERLNIGMPTVRTYWLRIRSKLGVNRQQAVQGAVQERLKEAKGGLSPNSRLDRFVGAAIAKLEQGQWLIESVDKGLAAMVGKSSKRLLNRPITVLVHRGDHALLEAAMGEVEHRRTLTTPIRLPGVVSRSAQMHLDIIKPDKDIQILRLVVLPTWD